MLHACRRPIAWFESQHNERKVSKDQCLWLGGKYDRQQTLVIRIAATTLASDSAITIARFRPSKRRISGNSSPGEQSTRARPGHIWLWMQHVTPKTPLAYESDVSVCALLGQRSWKNGNIILVESDCTCPARPWIQVGVIQTCFRSSSGKPTGRKWGSQTFREGVRNEFWNLLFKWFCIAFKSKKGTWKLPKGTLQKAPVEKKILVKFQWNSSKILVKFRKFKGNSSKSQERPLGRCLLELLEVPEPIRDSFLESSRTSFSSAWFARATPVVMLLFGHSKRFTSALILVFAKNGGQKVFWAPGMQRKVDAHGQVCPVCATWNYPTAKGLIIWVHVHVWLPGFWAGMQAEALSRHCPSLLKGIDPYSK